MYTVTITRVDEGQISHTFANPADAALAAAAASFAAGMPMEALDVAWWTSWKHSTAKGWQNASKSVSVDVRKD